MNPRASRTVPFVSKATGVPLAKIAARCMAGKTLAEQGATKEIVPGLLLGEGSDLPVRQVPGRRSDPRPGDALDRRGDGRGPQLRRGVRARARKPASIKAPPVGKAFISVRDPDKPRVLPVARGPGAARLLAGRHRAAPRDFLREQGLACERINKVIEGRPHIVDLIKNGEIVYIVNTTEGKQAIADSFSIRREALQQRVTYSTTDRRRQRAAAFARLPRQRRRYGRCRNCTRNWNTA